MNETIPIDLPDAEIGVLIGLNAPENVIGLAGILGWLCGDETAHTWELAPLTIHLSRQPELGLIAWHVNTPDDSHAGVTDTESLITAINTSLNELANVAREHTRRARA